jgi:hypothetical protein
MVAVRRFRQARMRMRPWIAMAAAFALALQVLLGGILATQAEAAGVSPDSPFVICYGSDSAAPADHGDTGKAPAKHLQCVLCTLAKLSHAIVATSAAAALDVRQLAAVVSPTAERVVQYRSPTGHYQRGPPALIVG